MTASLLLCGLIIAAVSTVRSCLWLLSFSTGELDAAIAIASGLGMSAAMFLLTAYSARSGCNNPHVLNGVSGVLFVLSVWATMDWAESGYLRNTQSSTHTELINHEYQSLLQDNRNSILNQQANATALTDIGHLSKSSGIQNQVEERIASQRHILGELQQHMSNEPDNHTGNAANSLGPYRWVLWLFLGAMLDVSGVLCLRIVSVQKEQHVTDPLDQLQATIIREIASGTHGDLPAVKRVAEHHSVSEERTRQIFQRLIQRGELTRAGNRYKRITATTTSPKAKVRPASIKNRAL